MSRTRKPCPACKEVDPRRPAGDVCYSCKRLLAASRMIEEQQAKKFELQYQVPNVSRYFPYVPHTSLGIRDSFRKAFFDVVTSLSVIPAVPDGPGEVLIPGTDGGYDNRTSTVYIDSADKDTMRNLYAAVIGIAREAYAKGKGDGQDFIRGMCAGEVTVNQFNEATLGK